MRRLPEVQGTKIPAITTFEKVHKLYKRIEE